MPATVAAKIGPRETGEPDLRRGRIGNLDVLRAVAALGVLAIHAYAFGGRAAPIKAQHFYDVPLDALSSGVWLFFAISGYVISRPFVDRLVEHRPLPGTADYAARRAARIFPLYWVALIVLIAIQGSAGTHSWQFPLHFLLLNNLAPGRQEALFPAAWTLTLEVLFYICLPLLAWAVRGRRASVSPERLAVLVLISWGASIAFTIVADLQGDGEIGVWLRGSLPAMWQMFCPGILLAILPHLRHARWRDWSSALRWSPWTILTIVLTLVAAMVLAADAPLRYGIPVYQLLVDASRPLYAIGYGLIVALAIRSHPWESRGAWILELGLISYGIYLLHPVVQALMLQHGWAPDPHNTLPAFLVNTLVLAAITIPLALLSWRALERPSIRAGRWLGARLGPGGPTMTPMAEADMRDFWNERAREDAFYFVDTRQSYKQADSERFWEGGPLIDYVLEGLGVRLTKEDTVLEIGCGVGRLTRALSERAGSVVALDVSDEMLAQARRLNPGLDNVRWLHGDGTSLTGVTDDSIDACVSLVVFQHLPSQDIALAYIRELGRVLRPGGWAALQVSNDPAVHRPRGGPWFRLKVALGRAPQGQRHPAWLGSPMEIPAVRRVAGEASLELDRVWGEGTQYCQLLLRKPVTER